MMNLIALSRSCLWRPLLKPSGAVLVATLGLALAHIAKPAQAVAAQDGAPQANALQAATSSEPAGLEPANLPPGGSNATDESPMMLYLVPWNANPESGKNGKKFTLHQPWGSHFDPLTPVQTQQLNTP